MHLFIYMHKERREKRIVNRITGKSTLPGTCSVKVAFPSLSFHSRPRLSAGLGVRSISSTSIVGPYVSLGWYALYAPVWSWVRESYPRTPSITVRCCAYFRNRSGCWLLVSIPYNLCCLILMYLWDQMSPPSTCVERIDVSHVRRRAMWVAWTSSILRNDHCSQDENQNW